MPRRNLLTLPTANTEGGALPPAGTTGKYLFNDTTTQPSNLIADSAAYPGQTFKIRETLACYYEIYDAKLVTALDRYYVPKYYLGTWQTIEFNSNAAVKREGKARYLETIIELDHTLVMSYKRQDGYTNYGLLEIKQCNFSLQPGTPISFEIAGVEINFVEYEVPSGRGSLFKGTYAIDRAYPVSDIGFRFPLSKVGFYTFQGASLVQLDYYFRQVDFVPGENYGYNQPVCPKF